MCYALPGRAPRSSRQPSDDAVHDPPPARPTTADPHHPLRSHDRPTRSTATATRPRHPRRSRTRQPHHPASHPQPPQQTPAKSTEGQGRAEREEGNTEAERAGRHAHASVPGGTCPARHSPPRHERTSSATPSLLRAPVPHSARTPRPRLVRSRRSEAQGPIEYPALARIHALGRPNRATHDGRCLPLLELPCLSRRGICLAIGWRSMVGLGMGCSGRLCGMG